MKTKTRYLIALAAVSVYGLSSCAKEAHEHAEEGHEHAEEGHEHAEEGHEHAKKAGPNGGRVLTEFEPHAEFFVTEDRKVRITFVDDDFKPVATEGQVATVVAGDRSDPTELSFTVDGSALISDKALPGGDDFPVVVMIKSTADGDEIGAKFQCNLKDCPTCDFKEYACICDHDEEK